MVDHLVQGVLHIGGGAEIIPGGDDAEAADGLAGIFFHPVGVFLGRFFGPGVHHSKGAQTQAAAANGLVHLLLAYRNAGVVQPVGDQQDAAQAFGIPGRRDGLQSGDNGSVEVGKSGGIHAGLVDALLTFFRSGQGLAEG